MSIYKRDVVAKMLPYYTTREQKVEFLKNRIWVFLRGEKGTFFSPYQICDQLGLKLSEQQFLVMDALDKLIKEPEKGVRVTADKTRYVYPREKQYV